MTCPLATNSIKVSSSFRVIIETQHCKVLPEHTAGNIHFTDNDGKVTSCRFYLDFNGDPLLSGIVGSTTETLKALQIAVSNAISDGFDKLVKPGMNIKYLFTTTRAAYYERFQ